MSDEGYTAGLLASPDSSNSDSSSNEFAAGLEMKLDSLGPMVVNSDGTISRIANWQSMTDAEKERTMRVVGARNQ
ncbi:hypothetical protein OBBRIDRAFT_738328 [Obba rivulosa]|uniref:Uncharacterized protein n=1 Tax=Obba rivulosa TaxID=1052685 RepID=A0A8E2AVP7_9APHY|nr:hypothetical protein OBBRIDRAFT_738328 [Obba rivulosa]